MTEQEIVHRLHTLESRLFASSTLSVEELDAMNLEYERLLSRYVELILMQCDLISANDDQFDLAIAQ